MSQFIAEMIIIGFIVLAAVLATVREKLTERREQAEAAEQSEARWLDWATWCEQQEAGQ